MARHGEAGPGAARPGKARQGAAGQGRGRLTPPPFNKKTEKMKKLMMTSDEYYNRKKIDDYMDEQLTSREGCRNLAVLIMVLAMLAVITTIFFMI